MAVYKEFLADIPDKNVVISHRKDGKVLVFYTVKSTYDYEKGYPKAKRVTIGHVSNEDEHKMHPNDNYKELFPEEWLKLTGIPILPKSVSIGFHALIEALEEKERLQFLLKAAFKQESADLILDLICREFLLTDPEVQMPPLLPFSRTSPDESALQEVFEKGLSETRMNDFKDYWMQSCSKKEIHQAWIYLMPLGKKERKASPLYALLAFSHTGLPLGYEAFIFLDEFEKSLDQLCESLDKNNIEVKGVLLDESLLDGINLSKEEEKDFLWIEKTAASSRKFEELVEQYGSLIQFNMAYWIFLKTYFGLCVQDQNSQSENTGWYDYLIFDVKKLRTRFVPFLDSLSYDLYGLEEEQEFDQEDPADLSALQDLNYSPSSRAELDERALEKKFKQAGFEAFRASKKIEPIELMSCWDLKDDLKACFLKAKPILKEKNLSVRMNASFRTTLFFLFLTSIIRYETRQILEEENRKIREEERMGNDDGHLFHDEQDPFGTESDWTLTGLFASLLEMDAVRVSNVYILPDKSFTHLDFLFEGCNQNLADLSKKIVNEYNDRLTGRVKRPRKRKPGPKKGRKSKKARTKEPAAKKRGVARGTKRSKYNKDGSLRQKPGCKPGTKRSLYNKDGSLRKKPGPKKAEINPD